MKNNIKSLLYRIGLAGLLETIRFRWVQFKNRKKNQSFKNEHPHIVLPPDFYLYETFGLYYERFALGGKKTAEWVLDLLGTYENLDEKSILDWGCGPGRIITHLPKINSSLKVFGTDYNAKYVEWCDQNISNITVKKNNLTPPLNFESNNFDAIYGISIFTHLSLEMHKAWLQELKRVLKTNGLLMVTTHGKASKILLNTKQTQDFENDRLVVQTYKTEGNRLYAAYQPEQFFRELTSSIGFDTLEHTEGKVVKGKVNQDVWVLRKR